MCLKSTSETVCVSLSDNGVEAILEWEPNVEDERDGQEASG